MGMERFDQICPEIGVREIRVCKVPEMLSLGLPSKYFLLELYCNEQDCDCRRVLVQFIPEEDNFKVAASINYGWEKAGYYKKWSRDPKLWREMAGATLEPSEEQGLHAKTFLRVFKDLVRDRMLIAVFRRHYRLVKDRLQVCGAGFG